MLSEPVARRLKALCRGIAARYGFAIVEQEVMPEHVPLVVSAPPRGSPAQLVNVLKGVSARPLRQGMPPGREVTWGGSLWSAGDFVRATGDAVTADIIQRDIRYQHRHEEGPTPLRFDC